MSSEFFEPLSYSTWLSNKAAQRVDCFLAKITKNLNQRVYIKMKSFQVQQSSVRMTTCIKSTLLTS